MSFSNDSSESSVSGYNVHRSSDRVALLKEIGLGSIDELFRDIPDKIRLKKSLDLPAPLTEWELKKKLQKIAASNATTQSHICLLGEGAYEHYIPAVVDAICSRGEFLTAYTPYQPEMSQGLLQVLFEYQTLISKLSDLSSVNCSMYDGATAMAEAAWMACLIKDRRHILASDAMWSQHKEVLKTYMKGRGVQITWVKTDATTGQLELPIASAGAQFAALIVQTPNMYGVLENLGQISNFCKASDCLFNLSYYPMLFGAFKSPGSLGVDILTCEGQAFGLPLAGGGPYLGILATHKKYERFMPGRIVGKLMDLKGQRAYALIREEREQHVSRDKATSHICSNQALQAIRTTVYLASVGEQGLSEIARQNVAKAHYLCEKLCAISGVKLKFNSAFFNEFTLEVSMSVNVLLKNLEQKGIFAGLPVGSDLRVAVTEVRSKEELDFVASCFAEEVKRHG